MTTHTFWLDRTPGTISAVLTLQRAVGNTVTKVFDKLPVATGQYPFTDGGPDDWVRGKGSTPFGYYWLSTKREALKMEPVGTPFYVISTNKGERTIIGPDGKTRSDIGLHLENRFPGSAGCVVLLANTAERAKRARALFDYLDKIHENEPYIRFTVL